MNAASEMYFMPVIAAEKLEFSGDPQDMLMKPETDKQII